MTDYKRMVSYMYQYDNGVKKKNVGFARVEAKNGQCKITLHMQLLGQLDSIFPTYLIQRDENNMELIYLGDTLLKNQLMDSKLTADEGNIMGSGYGLSAMGGLLLFLNDNVFFATEWDDKPIVAKEVLAALQPKSQKKKAPIEVDNIIKEDPDSGMQTLENDEKQEVAIDKSIKEDLQATEEGPLYSLAEELQIPKYKLPRGWKTVERLQMPGIESMSKHIAPLDLSNSLEQTEKSEQNEYAVVDEPVVSAIDNGVYEEAINSQEVNMFQKENMPQEENMFQEENMLQKENMLQEESDLTSEDRKEDTIEKMNISGEFSESEMPDHPIALHFFDNYPRIYPFEDNEIAQCVKIEAKDINILPKYLWTLSNNSFLMHGFYCYHHLIFAKLKDRFGCQYILGVPGIYHNRERFMARMFGFESFKSIRKRELRQGDFGYWYLPVQMNASD